MTTTDDKKPSLLVSSKVGLGAILTTALVSTGANAAEGGVDVTAIVKQFVGDGTTAISAVGVGLLTLAGIAIVFKWVKAAFFS